MKKLITLLSLLLVANSASAAWFTTTYSNSAQTSLDDHAEKIMFQIAYPAFVKGMNIPLEEISIFDDQAVFNEWCLTQLAPDQKKFFMSAFCKANLNRGIQNYGVLALSIGYLMNQYLASQNSDTKKLRDFLLSGDETVKQCLFFMVIKALGAVISGQLSPNQAARVAVYAILQVVERKLASQSH